ncbi:MAG: hypothetical protein ACRCU2_07890 [Planktothrix sp.]
MSNKKNQPLDPSESKPESKLLNVQNDAFIQRAQARSHQHRESHLTTSENRETVVTVEIPGSMGKKIKLLSRILGISTDILLNSSIHYFLYFSNVQDIEEKKIKGSSTNLKGPEESTEDLKDPKESSQDNLIQEIELGVRLFNDLKEKKLLIDVSRCLVGGLELLHTKLIEIDKVSE